MGLYYIKYYGRGGGAAGVRNNNKYAGGSEKG